MNVQMGRKISQSCSKAYYNYSWINPHLISCLDWWPEFWEQGKGRGLGGEEGRISQHSIYIYSLNLSAFNFLNSWSPPVRDLCFNLSHHLLAWERAVTQGHEICKTLQGFSTNPISEGSCPIPTHTINTQFQRYLEPDPSLFKDPEI